MVADRVALVVVDTNVLLAATDESRSAHQWAVDVLNRDPRRLAVTPQIVREYLVVATTPIASNGLGLTGADAEANVHEFLEGKVLLPEDAACVEVVRRWVGQGGVVGTQVHDANVVAVAQAHGASAVITDNARHFERYRGLIAIETRHVTEG